MRFNWALLTNEDYEKAYRYVGNSQPDLILAPDGKPYLYRWHLVPRNEHGNVYFHIQVASDPERPLHDHPWDNSSVILAGAYLEYCRPTPWVKEPTTYPCIRRVGSKVDRRATEAHRLELPPGIPYTMTLFTTGPKRREWGFWYPHGWVHNERVVRTANGVSIHEELK